MDSAEGRAAALAGDDGCSLEPVDVSGLVVDDLCCGCVSEVEEGSLCGGELADVVRGVDVSEVGRGVDDSQIPRVECLFEDGREPLLAHQHRQPDAKLVVVGRLFVDVEHRCIRKKVCLERRSEIRRRLERDNPPRCQRKRKPHRNLNLCSLRHLCGRDCEMEMRWRGGMRWRW